MNLLLRLTILKLPILYSQTQFLNSYLFPISIQFKTKKLASLFFAFFLVLLDENNYTMIIKYFLIRITKLTNKLIFILLISLALSFLRLTSLHNSCPTNRRQSKKQTCSGEEKGGYELFLVANSFLSSATQLYQLGVPLLKSPLSIVSKKQREKITPTLQLRSFLFFFFFFPIVSLKSLSFFPLPNQSISPLLSYPSPPKFYQVRLSGRQYS